MSAIAGIIHLTKEPVPFEHGRNLMKGLEKFPADDIQVWHKHNAFIGNHAQWITPESVGEQQPFYDSERQCVITADAIIDNRDELFEKLQVERSRQKQMPDSQLILLAYYKWGEESPKHLVGDFAYMIWDERNQKLFGARDFSGYRTLYYFQYMNQFTFCSTIDPLFSLLHINRKLNDQWLAEFLAISGPIDTVGAFITPYKGILQIPPAHSITVTKSKSSLNRYLQLTINEDIKYGSDNEYIEAFNEVFQKAVDSKLRTHRKIGSQLSGGLDSGAVVSFAAQSLKKQNKKLDTFSYIPPLGFQDYTPKQLMADESPFIKSTVDYVGGINDHYLDFEGRDSYSEIDSFIEVMETPYKFVENSFWLKGIIEAAHNEDVGVLLNGDRGNFSVSWGSALDYYSILFRKVRWIKLFNELNQYSKNVGGARLRRLPEIMEIAFPNIKKLLERKESSPFPPIINPAFAERTNVFEYLKQFGIGNNGWFTSSNVYEGRENIFGYCYPWNHGNTFTSKMSLKHSLWKRDPTNDLRVVRFCFSIPKDQFVQNGLDRALIRRSTEGYLPNKIRMNQQIRGVQGADWLYRVSPYWNSLIEEVSNLTRDSFLMEFLDRNTIESFLHKARQGVNYVNGTDPTYKHLLRCIILYRFLNKF